MKKLVLIAVLLLAMSGAGCQALDNVTEGNKAKTVAIAQETWGGMLIAELVSQYSMLPNLRLCFGKTNICYSTIPAGTSADVVNAQANLVKASNSSVSAGATGMSESNGK